MTPAEPTRSPAEIWFGEVEATHQFTRLMIGLRDRCFYPDPGGLALDRVIRTIYLFRMAYTLYGGRLSHDLTLSYIHRLSEQLIPTCG